MASPGMVAIALLVLRHSPLRTGSMWTSQGFKPSQCEVAIAGRLTVLEGSGDLRQSRDLPFFCEDVNYP